MTKQGKRAKRLIASLAVTAALALCAPAAALADDALGDVDAPAVSAKPAAASSDSDAQTAGGVDTSAVQVSKDGDAAALEGSSFAISDFSRAQKGSNRSIDGEYRGYAYLIGQGVGQAAQLIAVNDQVVASSFRSTLRMRRRRRSSSSCSARSMRVSRRARCP